MMHEINLENSVYCLTFISTDRGVKRYRSEDTLEISLKLKSHYVNQCILREN